MATSVYSFKTDLFQGPLEGQPNSFYKLNNSGNQVYRPFWNYIEKHMSNTDEELSQFGARTRFRPKRNQIMIQAVADDEDDEDSEGNIVIFTLNTNTGAIAIDYVPKENNAWVQFAEGDNYVNNYDDSEGRIDNIKEWLEHNAIETKLSQGGRRKTVKRKTVKRKTMKRKTFRR